MVNWPKIRSGYASAACALHLFRVRGSNDFKFIRVIHFLNGIPVAIIQTGKIVDQGESLALSP